jgi:prepilin-type N-terminal cleavage/methylation domain-containing protein
MVIRKPANPEPQTGAVDDARRDGFTMVEVIIAIIILAIGLMGMAGTTALVVRQITLADVATERSAAVQTTLERLRALPFDSVSSGSDSVGIFAVSWTSSSFQNQWKVLEVVTLGPGMTTSGGFPTVTASVADTFTYRIIRP